MKLSQYIKSLSVDARRDYAERCGTTLNYMNAHILHARKEPRKALRESLAAESGGYVSQNEVLEHFQMKSVATTNNSFPDNERACL